jgi:glycosyltransferase involved in cell wall biosynthesis
MRILFCNKYNFPFSGTEVYLFELMDLLRSRGHEVALFSMADSRGEATPLDQHFVSHIDFKDANVSWSSRVRFAGHAIYSTEARQKLRNMLASFRPDIAHIRNIYHHLSPSILWELKAKGIPVLYHLNDFKLLCPAYNLVTNGHACEHPCTGQYWKSLTLGCYEGPRGAAAVLAAEAYVHHWLGTYKKCVDHYLTPSYFAKELLVKNGYNQEKISVLPHFQHLHESPPSARADAPVLYFGRLSPEKGLTDLIYAMRYLPQIPLQIAGDGPQKPELERLTTTLELENVEFVGHLSGSNLDQAIAGSRFTILPSRAYETLGKSILESYAWERPVIASDLGSRRELVRDQETGLLYQAGDIDQLTKAILTLAEQPHRAAEMGIAGRRLIETKHTADKHYEQLMELYERLTSRPIHGEVAKQRPIRVAFIGGRGVISKYSGIEAYYEEAGRELAKLGYAMTIYCRKRFTPALPIHNGMKLIRLPAPRSKHFETVIHTFLGTLHAMFSSNDIIHYHALGPALFSFLPRLVGKKTVVTVQGLDWQRKKWGRLAARILRLGEAASARFPDRTMVVSRTLQEYYRAHYGKETQYVPNGANFRERTTPLQLGGWGLEPDDYVLFLGRFSPEKNCHLLIEAYKKVSTSARLVLAGGSSYTDEYATELRRHESEQIVLLNWISGDALDELITNAALFVLPSDLEGLSLALLEAMGAGICVLASDVSENREVVEGAGFTFCAGDVDDLARMMQLLLSNAEMRNAAGRAAKRVVRERYLWSEIALQIGCAYEDLMGRAAVPRPQPISVSSDHEEKLSYQPRQVA